MISNKCNGIENYRKHQIPIFNSKYFKTWSFNCNGIIPEKNQIIVKLRIYGVMLIMDNNRNICVQTTICQTLDNKKWVWRFFWSTGINRNKLFLFVMPSLCAVSKSFSNYLWLFKPIMALRYILHLWEADTGLGFLKISVSLV